jgi:hypothetical protein
MRYNQFICHAFCPVGQSVSRAQKANLLFSVPLTVSRKRKIGSAMHNEIEI